jgi:hypothetical protein
MHSRDVRLTSFIAVLTAYALVACSDHPAATIQTTSAIAPATASAAMPSSSASLPEVSGGGAEIDETPRADIELADNPCVRPPLHEPNGSTYSDVGMPYRYRTHPSLRNCRA